VLSDILFLVPTDERNSAKHIRTCPLCGSSSIARVDRNIMERIAGTFTGKRKYACLLCGHLFKKRFVLERGESEPL